MSMGFYNKYIFLNNSYLSIHIARQIYQKNKKSKNIDELIDTELDKQKIKNSLTNIKQKVQKKISSRKKIVIKPKEDSLKIIEENTNENIINFKKEEKIKFNSNNESITNRICNFS